jgi:hypothetical protein
MKPTLCRPRASPLLIVRVGCVGIATPKPVFRPGFRDFPVGTPVALTIAKTSRQSEVTSADESCRFDGGDKGR